MTTDSYSVDGYRADLDGLRALAVLAVVLFHFEVFPFRGGFVGVDVFFVISGFLITRLIAGDLSAGRFTFGHFYLRRVRRLFPAMLVTVGGSFLAASVYLGPQEFSRFGLSQAMAVLSLSNVFFWSESGYFDLASVSKPLLHFWSLSVEEQFYLVWPLTFFLVHRRFERRAILAGLLGVGLVGLAASEIWLARDADAAFYWMPFRIQEFAIGAILALRRSSSIESPVQREGLALAGIGLILGPIVCYSGATSFPGLHALVPCLGTACLIVVGENSRLCGVFRLRPVVGLGLISYSLYLVHWPILVFYRLHAETALTLGEKVSLIGFSILVACAMYWFVERPFRHSRARPGLLSDRQLGLTAVTAASLLVGLGLHVYISGGWPGRLPEGVRPFLDFDRTLHDENVGRAMRASASVEFDDLRPNVLVVGDSHAEDFFNVLELSDYADRFNRKGFGFPYVCRTILLPAEAIDSFYRDLPEDKREMCETHQRNFLASPLLSGADVVVLAGRWHDVTRPALDEYLGYTLRAIRARFDGRLVLLGNKAEWSHVPSLIVDYGRRNGLEDFLASKRTLTVSALNGLLAERFAGDVDAFVLRDAVLCPGDDFCHVFDEQERLLVYDYGHFTQEGARFVARLMSESGVFDQILGTEGDSSSLD